MSDFIRPINTQAINAVLDRFALKTYNGLGLNSTGGTASGNPRNVVVDQVTLSAAARKIFATSGSFFPERASGVGAVASRATRFDSVDLSGASFVGQILDGATFSSSILKDVNFVGASLRGAIFKASLVEGARFNQADLSGADLTGAQGLQFSQIQGAVTDTATVLPTGIGNPISG
ncbi:MAG: pentapeptide repeat-containing protein [Rhodospirillaceae bacterium]|nr:pentapeptide repeat-containing protein [Rhodospirillaceae bacterium]